MISEAGPSVPVIVSGLDELPAAGDKFYVVEDIDRARAIAEERSIKSRQNQLASDRLHCGCVQRADIFHESVFGDCLNIIEL